MRYLSKISVGLAALFLASYTATYSPSVIGTPSRATIAYLMQHFANPPRSLYPAEVLLRRETRYSSIKVHRIDATHATVRLTAYRPFYPITESPTLKHPAPTVPEVKKLSVAHKLPFAKLHIVYHLTKHNMGWVIDKESARSADVAQTGDFAPEQLSMGYLANPNALNVTFHPTHGEISSLVLMLRQVAFSNVIIGLFVLLMMVGLALLMNSKSVKQFRYSLILTSTLTILVIVLYLVEPILIIS